LHLSVLYLLRLTSDRLPPEDYVLRRPRRGFRVSRSVCSPRGARLDVERPPEHGRRSFSVARRYNRYDGARGVDFTPLPVASARRKPPAAEYDTYILTIIINITKSVKFRRRTARNTFLPCSSFIFIMYK
jgi:hypothetical protein